VPVALGQLLRLLPGLGRRLFFKGLKNIRIRNQLSARGRNPRYPCALSRGPAGKRRSHNGGRHGRWPGGMLREVSGAAVVAAHW